MNNFSKKRQYNKNDVIIRNVSTIGTISAKQYQYSKNEFSTQQNECSKNEFSQKYKCRKTDFIAPQQDQSEMSVQYEQVQ
jgi:hypothetical protein